MKQSEKTKLTYEKILKAAMEEFGAKGYAGASLNNICATGIPKGLLYHNFRNKDAVYLACVEQCFRDLTACLKEANVGDDLQKYVAVRLNFFHENENEARIFFDAILQPPDALREQINELRTELDELNSRVYKKILSAITLRKGISSEDALEYFTMQQTMFNGYFSSPTFRNLSFAEKMTAHETNLSKLLDMMLYGIAERGENK